MYKTPVLLQSEKTQDFSPGMKADYRALQEKPRTLPPKEGCIVHGGSYQDSSLLIIDKPAGLVVDESNTHQGDTLEAIMKKKGVKLERGGIVHRLDKDTSGLLLVAKTQEALENLQKQFAQRQVKKEYLALVHGFVEKGGIVVGAVGRNPVNREKFMVISPGRSQSPPSRWPNGLLEGGRWAQTGYEPLKKFKVQSPPAGRAGEKLKVWFPDFNKIQMRKLERMKYGQFTLLSCFPKTGRTHQIRVHLKYIGHPIVSDSKYSGRKMVRLDRRWCPRMFLHAKKIEFKHPVGGEKMVFESKLPEDLEGALGYLR